jgi:UDPglucose 6-dehydrogenase
MRIAIIGCGYVGLITSVGFCHLGHDVLGVEIDKERLDALKQNQAPIYEPGLVQLLAQARRSGRLSFTSSIKDALDSCQILFICVSTPPKNNGEPDLSQIDGVLQEIGRHLPEKETRFIVNKSTVPVGTYDYVHAMIEDYASAWHSRNGRPLFKVISNPEFLREGCAFQDFFYPDRIVIGSKCGGAFKIMRDVYQPLVERIFEPIEGLRPPDNPTLVVETDPHTAELIKYGTNAFLAMKISFINEIADISSRVGADIRQVSAGIGSDKRIGPAFLQSGVGWGGSCLRKDILALSHLAHEHNVETKLLEATISVNDQRRLKVVETLQSEMSMVKGKRFAILGLSFKPNTDDSRDAPSLSIINHLLNLGAMIRAYDPKARIQSFDNPRFQRSDNVMDALAGANAALIMTEWDEFTHLNPAEVKTAMSGNLILDARNCLDIQKWERSGLRIVGIG